MAASGSNVTKVKIIPIRPKKKNCLFPSERPGEIFFSDDAAGKFFSKQQVN